MCVPLHPYGTIPRNDSLPECQSNIQITDVYEKNIVFRLHHAYMAKHRCNSKYSLNGVKVDKPSKGLYIKNGKKVIL